MFVDDATFAMDGSLKSFQKNLCILDDFKLISGLKLNVNKTTLLRVGSLKYTNIQHLKNLRFLWTSNSAKTLGIIFSNDKQKIIENNLIPKLNDFVNCLKRWNHRKLSLMGKITVVKTFALPKLIYPLTVLNNPTLDILKKIKFEIFNLIWDSKPDKIKNTQVITKEIIWNNSQIKCNNKILFYNDWYEKGIKLIKYIYDFRVQRFYTLEQLQNVYNIHQKDFLKYYNIVSSISKE